MKPLLHLAAALLLFGSIAAAQAVHVVDDDAGPGVDFATISAALSAAAEGDVILVRDGSYTESALNFDGKGVTLSADLGASVSIQGQFLIENLAANQVVVVEGLDAINVGPLSEVVILEANQGTVWFEGCSFAGFPLSLFSGPDTVIVSDSQTVVFQDCTIVGGGVVVAPFPGGDGIAAQNSSVYVYDSLVVGGKGPGDPSTPGPGGIGIDQCDGQLFAVGSVIQGGAGGDGGSIFTGCADGGTGGVGLRLTGTAPIAYALDSQLVGGLGGTPMGAGSCMSGASGADTQIDAGQLVDIPWPTHRFEADSPVRTDELLSVSFEGTPGELAWFGVAAEPGALLIAELFGVLFQSFPVTIRPAGAMDAAGTATVSVPAPDLLGAEGADFFVQALFFDPFAGLFTLGPAAAVVVLDSAF